MSVGTLGAVDFRSDKERTAAYAKATKKQAQQQTRIMQQQLAAQQRAAAPQPVYLPPVQQVPPPPTTAPAGWYPDQNQVGMLRWFDGFQWTDHTQPAGAPPQ